MQCLEVALLGLLIRSLQAVGIKYPFWSAPSSNDNGKFSLGSAHTCCCRQVPHATIHMLGPSIQTLHQGHCHPPITLPAGELSSPVTVHSESQTPRGEDKYQYKLYDSLSLHWKRDDDLN